jgi:TonB family protein
MEHGMRRAKYALMVLALAVIGTRPQESKCASLPIHQTPDESGVFYTGPEVSAPRLVRTLTVPYPPNVESNRIQGMTVLAMVIDVKGIPQHIQVLHSHGYAFDQGAIAAVQHSEFEPGKLSDKPVPVWIDVRVVFHANRSQAVPQVLITERDLPAPEESQLVDKLHKPLAYTAPIPIHTVDADFADPFAKHPWVQVAVVDVLVNEEGLPKDVRVRRGLGFGLDEKAAAAVWHYRFLPATKNGKPIEARRNVMVDFAEF